MVTITLNDVTVDYANATGGRIRALDHLDLHVRSGELLVLAGPSGSGKTTVLRAIAGLEPLLGGTVVVDNHIINELAPGERDVALVSQYETNFPHLTVEQNLSFGLQVRKLPQEETNQRVRAEARVLGLWSKRDRRPGQLSSGERQKTALGRATTRKPRIFLFDEPLAGLDAAERDRVRREFLRLQRGLSVTTVYVTHDQRDAMSMGDRIAILDRGRLMQIDTPMALYQRPASLFVAQFLGSPPMGVIEGLLHDDGTTAWLEVAGAVLRLHPTQRAAVVTSGQRAQIAVGLRASAVSLDRAADDEWTRRLPLLVRSVEPLGPSTTVALTATANGRSPLYATAAPGTALRRGATCTVTIDLREALIFDALSGRRLYPW
jgi:multiple sugar transport system ATP-binding protein